MSDVYSSKKDFFNNGNTISYDFRIKQLKNLKNSIKTNEDNILKALNKDLHKHQFEAYSAELGVVYEELNNAIKNLKSWMKVKTVATPVYLQPAKSYIYSQPKGVVLIISPWNYPFQLAIAPLIGAIAGGNCAILKPSNQSKDTEKIIQKIISETFSDDYISVVTGPGSQVVTKLINNHRFDHIFFTGSVDVGKTIMELSAKDLTTVTLELGGKSPTIVHEDADIDLTAKRLVWAKFYNAGQTCIAPDYLLVHESKKKDLIDKLKFYIKEYYGENPMDSQSFGRIINHKRFDRLISFLNEGNILVGGDYNRDNKFIAPTLIDNINLSSSIMKEEIFGPILPILTYKDIKDVVSIIRENQYPLALYLFTNSSKIEDYIMENVQFGGGCINHAILHVANSNLPFGGFGYSGIGNYHSKNSFDTFTHKKSIFKANALDLNIIYPPYKNSRLNLVKKFLK